MVQPLSEVKPLCEFGNATVNPYRKKARPCEFGNATVNPYHKKARPSAPHSPTQGSTVEACLDEDDLFASLDDHAICAATAELPPLVSRPYDSDDDEDDYDPKNKDNAGQKVDDGDHLVDRREKQANVRTEAELPPLVSHHYDSDSDGDDDEDDYDPSISVPPVFQVFATGVKCFCCQKPVGSGASPSLSAVKKHLHKYHSPLIGDQTNFAIIHRQLQKALCEIMRQQRSANHAPNTVEEEVQRYKCSIPDCSKHFAHRSSFARHVSESNGHCFSAVPLPTKYTKTTCGRLIELATQQPSNPKIPAAVPPVASALATATAALSPPDNAAIKLTIQNSATASATTALSPPDYTEIESKLEKFVPEDEDVGVFVTMYTPLMITGIEFEAHMSNLVNRWSMPVARIGIISLTTLGQRPHMVAECGKN